MKPLSATQVLQIAMELEEKMQVCYEILATVAGRHNQTVPRMFEECSLEENEHYRIFDNLFAEQCARKGEPKLLTERQQQAVLDRFGGPIMPDLSTVAECCRSWSLREALEFALTSERQSVTFYSEFVSPLMRNVDLPILEKVIEEEKKHERELLEKYGWVLNQAA